MQTKSFLSSKTVWGAVLLFVLAQIHNRTGVKLDDQVAPLTSAIGGIVSTLNVIAGPIGQFAAVILTIVGRFRAAQGLHIVAPGSTAPKPPLAVIAFAMLLSLVCMGGLTGCASSAGSGAAGSSAVSAGPTLTQTIAADFKGLTGDALSFANGLQKLNNGNALPPAAVTAILNLTHNSGDAATAAVLNNVLGQFIAATATAATPDQSITNANMVLAPANVNATVQAVTPSVPATPPTPTAPSTNAPSAAPPVTVFFPGYGAGDRGVCVARVSF